MTTLAADVGVIYNVNNADSCHLTGRNRPDNLIKIIEVIFAFQAITKLRTVERSWT
jgi:hypothetical protein